MGIIESFFLLFGKWFGYVGACLVVPDATCRPFLAFIALAAAATAALTLVLMAYRAAQRRESIDMQAQAPLVRTAPVQERARRTRAEPRLTQKPSVQPRVHAAA